MNKTFAIQLVATVASGSALARGCSRSTGSSHGSRSSGAARFVHGHATKNGNYVAPHRQTNPDGTKRNNWSSKGNANPDTGKAGTKDPNK